MLQDCDKRCSYAALVARISRIHHLQTSGLKQK